MTNLSFLISHLSSPLFNRFVNHSSSQLDVRIFRMRGFFNSRLFEQFLLCAGIGLNGFLDVTDLSSEPTKEAFSFWFRHCVSHGRALGFSTHARLYRIRGALDAARLVLSGARNLRRIHHHRQVGTNTTHPAAPQSPGAKPCPAPVECLRRASRRDSSPRAASNRCLRARAWEDR